MSNEPVVQDFFLPPGHIVAPLEPMRLAVVVASGVAVTVFDTKRKRGGMAHYIAPYRRGMLSTAMFAAPSIITLVEMLRANPAEIGPLEARLYGGAKNPESPNFEDGLSEANVQVGKEILMKLNIPLVGTDIGGERGRKIVFHSGTGEVVVASVDRVRNSDWYPPTDKPIER